jgi:hypothetical protein
MAGKFVEINFGGNLDFTKFTFSSARKNPSGGSSVGILYEGKTPIMILPPFYVFAPSTPEGANIPKITAKLPSDKYKTPETDQFRENIDKLTALLNEEAIKQGRGVWVPSRVQKLTPESVAAVMNPLLKVPEDPTKCPLFNCKFDGWESVTTEIFDAKGNVVPLDAPIEAIVPSGSIVKMKVVPKVWVSPNGFGVTFTIKKLKKEPVSGGIPRGAWELDGAPAEEAPKPVKSESMEVELPHERQEVGETPVNTLQVADSDEETTTDPDAEYSSPNNGAAEEPPMKSRKKIAKKV